MEAQSTRVFLIGFMGVGKTTLGRRLSRRLGLEYRDLDQEIEFAAGMFIPEIFSMLGEDQFRKMEAETLRIQPKGCLIACGGGTPCFLNNMDWMNENGITVYLQADPNFLSDRLKQSKKPRPLIQGKEDEQLKQYIRAKLAERESFYKKAKILAPLPRTKVRNIAEMIQEF